MKASTLKYIAKELGISAATVSRALNGKAVVKEETRKRVLEAAKKYSYTPNQIARSLQKSSTETIAVVLPDISESFFGTIVKELERTVAHSGYMIILSDTHEEAKKEQKYLDMLYKRRVDAIVLATVDCDGTTAEQIVNAGIPVVFIDNIPKLSDADAITIDNQKASYIAVEHLVKNGHRKIAAIFGSKTETTGEERFAGFNSALNAFGIEKSAGLLGFGDYKYESGYNEMKRLLKNRDSEPFSAVYITSEKMTYGAMRAIRDEGLSVPEDLSVVGFDIHNLADDRRQMITSVRQPEEEIGRRVGELLLTRINGNDTECSRVLLEPYLEKGDTVKKI